MMATDVEEDILAERDRVLRWIDHFCFLEPDPDLETMTIPKPTPPDFPRPNQLNQIKPPPSNDLIYPTWTERLLAVAKNDAQKLVDDLKFHVGYSAVVSTVAIFCATIALFRTCR